VHIFSGNPKAERGHEGEEPGQTERAGETVAPPRPSWALGDQGLPGHVLAHPAPSLPLPARGERRRLVMLAMKMALPGCAQLRAAGVFAAAPARVMTAKFVIVIMTSFAV